MTALVLRLAGPMQAWGDRSRFVRRETRPEPTKSGVLGLLAAAQGRRRTDPLEDLMHLRFGVRMDQPGRLLPDFQVARSLDGRTTMPLSRRFYLTDAIFLAVVEGDDALIEAVEAALHAPVFPLYLGRRSCPPAGPVSRGLRSAPLDQVLSTEPWQAATWYRRQNAASSVRLAVLRDADPGESGEVLRDVPISFDPERREYGWRTVTRYEVTVHNPDGRGTGSGTSGAPHDPMLALGSS